MTYPSRGRDESENLTGDLELELEVYDYEETLNFRDWAMEREGGEKEAKRKATREEEECGV